MLLINDIKTGIHEEEGKLKEKIEKILRHPIRSYEIRKRSLDARRDPVYVYSVAVEIDNEERFLRRGFVRYEKEDLSARYLDRNQTCIIAGYGPSGIFSAFRLIEAGYRVLVFEKGKRIAEREKDVERFFREGILDEESNVQFGEGGAGTFSDAKLTTRLKDRYIDYILDILIRHGGKSQIRYEHHAHIGTDEIRRIIAAITDDLIEKGCEFHFSEPVRDLCLDENRKVTSVVTDKGTYQCDHFLLGIGHSARETFEMLKRNDVYMEKKDIAIGFRVEHPQSLIDERQTGSLVEEANEYFLRHKDTKGVYSFCMCPGGIVVPAMSEKNTVVTNGMSYAARDSGIANSAILIQVRKDEFDDGFRFLEKIEKEAYDYSGSYRGLSQNIRDYMSGDLGPLQFESTYPLKTVLFDFNRLFTEEENGIMKRALLDFDRKIPGFIDKGIMVGPETRSSCPVRILRNEKCQSVNTPGLYPMGEGAGYGGGIVSCALDGIRIANAIISGYETIQE